MASLESHWASAQGAKETANVPDLQLCELEGELVSRRWRGWRPRGVSVTMFHSSWPSEWSCSYHCALSNVRIWGVLFLINDFNSPSTLIVLRWIFGAQMSMGIMGITLSFLPRTGLTSSQSFWAVTCSHYDLWILKFLKKDPSGKLGEHILLCPLWPPGPPHLLPQRL